ncbi:DUF7146 domain-containing protein [Paracoccus mutanolyticus]
METYLRGRGITSDLPKSLRFHPDCWHPSAQRAPAMVARIDGLPRLAVHRTYLRHQRRGRHARAIRHQLSLSSLMAFTGSRPAALRSPARSLA